MPKIKSKLKPVSNEPIKVRVLKERAVICNVSNEGGLDTYRGFAEVGQILEVPEQHFVPGLMELVTSQKKGGTKPLVPPEAEEPEVEEESPYADMTYQSLRKAAKEIGLDTTGTMAELRERLEAAEG